MYKAFDKTKKKKNTISVILRAAKHFSRMKLNEDFF